MLDRIRQWLRQSREVKAELSAGPLVRPESFVQAHRSWLATTGREMLKWISENYERALRYPKNEASAGDDLFLYQSGPATGVLVVATGTPWSLEDWQHLLDELKNRVSKVQHYLLSHADVRQRLLPAGIETIERYALKPDIRTMFDQGQIQQMFGGVRLDLAYLNQKPMQLRVILDRVRDRRYTEALPAEWLLKNLFKPELD